MTISTRIYDTTGNHEILDGVQLSYDTMLNTPVARNLQPSIVCGTGVPTFTAPKGTIYTRLDGGAATMLYVNNNGATTWSVVTSA